jgi:AcrR family transcriptional regulator
MDSSRSRLIAAAEELLRETGMAGSGIKDVVARSGAPIGSVYHFFPGGKTQLVMEALEIHGERSRHVLERFFDGKRSAAEAVRMLFDTAAEGFERAGANRGCAIGAVALDLTEGDTAIRDVCRTTFDGWIQLIAPHLPFATQKTRRTFAHLIISALEGAFIIGKSKRSGDPFRDSGRWIAAALEWKPKSNPRRRR